MRQFKNYDISPNLLIIFFQYSYYHKSIHIIGVLAEILPDKLILLFDGWDDGCSKNLIGIYVVFIHQKTQKITTYLLRIAPMNRIDDYSADSHIETIEIYLGRFGKNWDNIIAIAGAMG